MRLLITGAYGLLGSHIASYLRARGHEIVAAGRNVELGQHLYPQFEWVHCDFNRDTAPEVWQDRLKGIDAVVNCVGILQGSRRDNADAIHRAAPDALFRACEDAGISRVIQISALGAGEEAGTAYASTKAAGDTALAERDINWVILRPSLVYTRDCYGGTAMIRGLAGLPLITPLIGGEQLFQPVHMDDLSETVLRLLGKDAPSKLTLNVVGPEEMPLSAIVARYRQWLGFPKVPQVKVPRALVALAARGGDIAGYFGSRTTLRTTAIKQMQRPVTAPLKPLVEVTGLTPRSFDDALAAEPSTVQDRWHARLFFLKPAMRVVLALFWIISGLVLLHPAAFAGAVAITESMAFPPGIAAPFTAIGGGVFDVTLGALLLARWRAKLILTLMALGTVAYIGALVFLAPEWWLAPLGPLTKTFPVLMLTLAVWAIEDDR